MSTSCSNCSDSGLGELVQHAHVLAQHEHAAGLGVGDADILPGAADGRLGAAHAGAHADVVLMSQGYLPHPVDPQRWLARMRLELDDDSTGAVGEHPPEEV